ncbi:hypothetical protein EDD86DRAFT_244086 [Gorgonomyces haynaldii]|nr:hypothetical protein EDD86DRAFT_244086 [Gorgonomyces haynaldii]
MDTQEFEQEEEEEYDFEQESQFHENVFEQDVSELEIEQDEMDAIFDEQEAPDMSDVFETPTKMPERLSGPLHMMSAPPKLSRPIEEIERMQNEFEPRRSAHLADMLAQARGESQQLRDLNEKLLQTSEDYRQKLAYLELEKERESERSKRKQLEEHILKLQNDLQTAHTSQSQISAIRQSLEREKELDILNVKKDLLAQKERQLNEIRNEMHLQKEQMKRVFDIELEAKEKQYQKQLSELKPVEIQKPETRDASEQASESLPIEGERDALKTQIHYLKEQLLCLFSDQQSYDLSMDQEQLIEHCRQYIGQMEHKLLNTEQRLQHALDLVHTQQSQLQNTFQQEKQQLELKHQETTQSLKQAHQAELSQQQKVYENRIKQVQQELGNKISNMEHLVIQKPSEPKINTLQDLLKIYPVLMATYRSQIESLLHKPPLGQNNQLEQRHVNDTFRIRELENEMKSMDLKHKQLMQQAKENHDNKILHLEQLHKRELSQLSQRLKDHCAKAYDNAIVKLKEEYSKLEKHLRSKFEREYAQQKLDLEQKLQNDTKREKSSSLALYTMQIKQLESIVNIKEQSKQELENAKTRYVNTLKKMRDDLAESKRSSWERLEREWIKRKQLINEEWLKR